MSEITAFHSKDFKRSNRIGEKFFSPLGCGVTVSKTKEFQELYVTNMTKLLEKG